MGGLLRFMQKRQKGTLNFQLYGEIGGAGEKGVPLGPEGKRKKRESRFSRRNLF